MVIKDQMGQEGGVCECVAGCVRLCGCGCVGVCVLVLGWGQYVWADKECEGRYVAFSFRGQGIVHSPWQVAVLFARSMQGGCKMNVNNVN